MSPDEIYHVYIYSNGKRDFITSNQIQDFQFDKIGPQSDEYKKQIFLYDHSDGKNYVCQILVVASKFLFLLPYFLKKALVIV